MNANKLFDMGKCDQFSALVSDILPWIRGFPVVEAQPAVRLCCKAWKPPGREVLSDLTEPIGLLGSDFDPRHLIGLAVSS